MKYDADLRRKASADKGLAKSASPGVVRGPGAKKLGDGSSTSTPTDGETRLVAVALRPVVGMRSTCILGLDQQVELTGSLTRNTEAGL